MSPATHWAARYIGEPWVANSHDCWAFVRRVYADRFGIDVPPVDVDACSRMACSRAFAGHPEREHWALVDSPSEGDAVLMGKSERAAHVGVWVEAGAGSVLHCVQGAGVVLSTRASLKSSGWRILGFYRRAAA